MGKRIVNLTMAVVTEEVERVLETYPEYPHRQFFAPGRFREDLIVYVLNHISPKYAVLEDGDEAPLNRAFNSCPTEQRLQMEDWIQIGIHNLLIDYGVLLGPREWAALSQSNPYIVKYLAKSRFYAN